MGPQTLRYYERRGLLREPDRSPAGTGCIRPRR
ncbi:MerR family DNA-binding transcriptional regulator [Actinomadura madurae]|nr:MerR family DNA-binding transcriptional regulator [Actinomadura madurae]